MDLFFEIHSGLPREAPGDADSTRRAVALMAGLPAHPRILDVGCGPGAQTIDVAVATGGTVSAVDTHGPFLVELAQRADAAGLGDRVIPVHASMFDLPFAPATFDAVVSEGAVYIMGFEAGLRAFRELVVPGGYVAVTELTWLEPDPPAAPAAFWRGAYPGMSTRAENLAAIARAGYDEVGHFTLPQASWWDAYYTPLERRIVELREKHAGNVAAECALDAEHAEIELYREYADWYGYVYYVMRRPEDESVGSED